MQYDSSGYHYACTQIRICFYLLTESRRFKYPHFGITRHYHFDRAEIKSTSLVIQWYPSFTESHNNCIIPVITGGGAAMRC